MNNSLHDSLTDILNNLDDFNDESEFNQETTNDVDDQKPKNSILRRQSSANYVAIDEGVINQFLELSNDDVKFIIIKF